MAGRAKVQRVAAYAVILRDGRILLSRLSSRVTSDELWTLPGGGLDHGEDPRIAVVREVLEETGLPVEIGDRARVYSLHTPHAWRDGRRVDAHAIRIVYDGWVPIDAPEPRVVEVGGSTVEAAWHPVSDVLDGTLPTVSLVGEALADHRPARLQRTAAYALCVRADAVLLTRISPRGYDSGTWTLPGGGIDFGESPRDAVEREVTEECGVACTVGDLLVVHDLTVRGTGPSGRDEEFQGIHLVFTGSVPAESTPRVTEVDGTTDAVAWVPLAELDSADFPVNDLVRTALAARSATVGGMTSETVFTYAAPALKFGIGASSEVGFDLASYDAKRVLLVTDPGVAATGHPARIADEIRARGLEVVIFDGARVEPTDESLDLAISFARDAGAFDAILAVGGGSSIDTAKAVNLLTTNPGELMDYINAPVGRATAPTKPLLPLVAIPTTTGTGSESTTICVLDVLSLKVKTGISHPLLRPRLAIVDPSLTLSQPAMVTAASGMDILCHALESYTARWFGDFDAKTPEQRVPYCGANPIADMWSEKAMSLLAGAFRTAVQDGSNEVGREQMAMAATFAGLGFGNAGVHIPHANAYPIAGRVRSYHPAGYPDEAIVPHGMAVSLTAPEAFRFTYSASPDRHLAAARLLDPTVTGSGPDVLPGVLSALMRDIGIPSGLAEVGYSSSDVPDLVDGSLKQQRLLATAPRDVTEDDLATVIEGSLENW